MNKEQTIQEATKVLSRRVSELLAEGYLIVPNDSSQGNISRVELTDLNFKRKVRLVIYNTYEQRSEIIHVKAIDMEYDQMFEKDTDSKVFLATYVQDDFVNFKEVLN